MKNKKGFSLVELIVVISILAILGTISFISFQGYLSSSRDSVRITDMVNIEKTLDLYYIGNSKYPDTTNGFDITFEQGGSSTLWTQGVFGYDTFKEITTLNKIPMDPLIDKEYIYSVTENKKEYEIAGVFESNDLVYINQANANDKKGYLKIKGDYNGKIIKTKIGATDYILAVPSIITSTGGTILDIITNNRLNYSGYKNLPAQYDGTKYNIAGEATTLDLVDENEYIVFSGSLSDLSKESNYTGRANLITGLQEAYEGTNIESNQEMLVLTSIEASDSIGIDAFAANIINNNLSGNYTSDPSSVPVLNYSPVAPTVSDQTVDLGVAITTITLPEFSDADNDTLTYSVSGLPNGLSFNSSTREITGTPSVENIFVVTYTADDGNNSVVDVSFNFTIEDNSWASSGDGLECRAIDTISFECRWPTIIEGTYRIVANLNECTPGFTTETSGTINTESNNCGGMLTKGNNNVNLIYDYDNLMESTMSVTIDFDEPTLTTDLFDIDATGFDFDLSSINYHPSSDFRFQIGGTICNETFSSSDLVGRIDTSDTNCGMWINPGSLSVQLVYDYGNYEFSTNSISLDIPQPTITQGMFTADATGFDFDLTGINALLSSTYTFNIGGDQCSTEFSSTSTTGRIDDNDANCGFRILSGETINVTLVYDIYNNLNQSNMISIDIP